MRVVPGHFSLILLCKFKQLEYIKGEGGPDPQDPLQIHVHVTGKYFQPVDQFSKIKFLKH